MRRLKRKTCLNVNKLYIWLPDVHMVFGFLLLIHSPLSGSGSSEEARIFARIEPELPIALTCIQILVCKGPPCCLMRLRHVERLGLQLILGKWTVFSIWCVTVHRIWYRFMVIERIVNKPKDDKLWSFVHSQDWKFIFILIYY